MICLDTNAVIAVLNDQTSRSARGLAGRSDWGARSRYRPLLFELRYGAAKIARPERNTQRIVDFLSGPIEFLPFEPAVAEEAGDIRAALERAGTPIGPYDVLLVAQARRCDAVLVTAYQREFARVPRPKYEDWAKAT